MNRRLLVTFAVIPLIGLLIQGAASVRARHEDLRRVQYADRLRRRAMTFSAVKEAERAVLDALRKEKTTAGEPSLGGGVSVSEGPMPKDAFRLPTGVWWPRDTFAVREETWSVEGTYSVREKAAPRTIRKRLWKVRLLWEAKQHQWRVFWVRLDYDPLVD